MYTQTHTHTHIYIYILEIVLRLKLPHTNYIASANIMKRGHIFLICTAVQLMQFPYRFIFFFFSSSSSFFFSSSFFPFFFFFFFFTFFVFRGLGATCLYRCPEILKLTYLWHFRRFCILRNYTNYYKWPHHVTE